MIYVYPAVFHFNEDDGSYTIFYPDLPGCISEGKTLENALQMAHSALREWIEYHLEKERPLAEPSGLSSVKLDAGEFANLVRVEIKDTSAVRRNVSLPKWMDDGAIASGLSLSRVLQDALSERLAK